MFMLSPFFSWMLFTGPTVIQLIYLGPGKATPANVRFQDQHLDSFNLIYVFDTQALWLKSWFQYRLFSLANLGPRQSVFYGAVQATKVAYCQNPFSFMWPISGWRSSGLVMVSFNLSIPITDHIYYVLVLVQSRATATCLFSSNSSRNAPIRISTWWAILSSTNGIILVYTFM